MEAVASDKASEIEIVMSGDLEIAVKSENSQFDAKFDGTPMIKEWEDLKRYVTSTSVEDTSGKVVRSILWQASYSDGTR